MEFTADDIFKEIYELREIMNFILSENKSEWFYILTENKETDKNTYDDIFGKKESSLKDIYFGEYGIGKKLLKSKNKKSEKEYIESYKERIKNNESMIFETIRNREKEIEKVFEDDFYILKDYRESFTEKNNFKNILGFIYGSENKNEEEIADMLFKKESSENEVFKSEKNNYFTAEEKLKNIIEKSENGNAYKFKEIVSYVNDRKNTYGRNGKQKYEPEISRDINITLNNYNSEYGRTDEESIINSIAEKIIEYAQCGAEGIHI